MIAPKKITENVWLYSDGETLAESAMPCPFCGNKYIKTSTRERYEGLTVGGMDLECQKCGTEMWYFPDVHEKPDYEIVLRGLIEKWNRRSAV